MNPATLPELNMVLADGTPMVLTSLIGAPAVLYFYPKADTSGCTREAQEFSALVSAFAAAGTTVLGISRDLPAALAKFAAKRDLSVRLASDVDGAVCEAFGVWGEKQMYGRSYMGIERATFLFDAGGRLSQAWRKVRVPGHAEVVLAAARALAG